MIAWSKLKSDVIEVDRADVVQMMQRNLNRNLKRLAACAMTISAALSLSSLMAYAQSGRSPASPPPLSAGLKFVEMSGEELFANVCQGCHMSDGKGATGAGTYPSLAGNSNLEVSGYPVAIVVNGQRGMPPFGAMMSDDQVAAVVNYLRTHFGNHYRDAVTIEDVKIVRR
jgi:mono/diheme cytochrome c family protein